MRHYITFIRLDTANIAFVYFNRVPHRYFSALAGLAQLVERLIRN
jgi:hypothetical protein